MKKVLIIAIPVIVILVLLYFFWWKPKKDEQKKADKIVEETIQNIEEGTTGPILSTGSIETVGKLRADVLKEATLGAMSTTLTGGGAPVCECETENEVAQAIKLYKANAFPFTGQAREALKASILKSCPCVKL